MQVEGIERALDVTIINRHSQRVTVKQSLSPAFIIHIERW